jgi:hypothetical protein
MNLSAQEDSSGLRSSLPTICLLPSVNLSVEKEISEEYKDIITGAIEVELQNAGYNVVRVVKPESADARYLLGIYALRAAQNINADLLFTGFYRIEDNRIIIQIKAYDARKEQFIAGRLSSGPVSITLFNMINSALGEILLILERYVLPVNEERTEEEQESNKRIREVILLSADENAEVYWAGKASAGRIIDGSLRLNTVKDTQLVLEIRKEGYHPGEETIDLGEQRKKPGRKESVPEDESDASEDEELVFVLKPLMKETLWGVEFLYTAGQTLGLGFGLRYYFHPDELFLSGEDYFFLQTAFIEGNSPVFHNDLRVLLGKYIFVPPAARMRIGISTGAGVILTSFAIPGIPFYTDFYLNAVNLWVEWNAENWVFYLRQEHRYMLGIFNNLLGRKWHSDLPWGVPITFGMVKKWQR